MKLFRPQARLRAILSLPAWGAWIEIISREAAINALKSLPAWGAWIEIPAKAMKRAYAHVAPRMGSVD